MPKLPAVATLPILLTTVLVVGSARSGVAQRRPAADPQLATAKANYAMYLARLPFLMHTRGREKFARTGHPEALKILRSTYDKAWMDTPVDQHNYLLVSMSADAFQQVDHLDQLADWRQRFARDADAWLWFRTLQVHQRIRGDAESLATLRDKKHKFFVQMAALETLGDGVPRDVLPAVQQLLAELPRKPVERSVTLRCAASVLLQQKNMLGTNEYRDAITPLIHALDHKDTDLQTKIVIARHLRLVLPTDQMFIESRPWLALLAGETGPKDRYAHLYAQPKFFGVEGSGTRIAYVIDMSDSMCKPLSADFLKGKPKGPITGPKKKTGKKGDAPDEDDIPWRIVKTRFDLAREQLKLSLRQLGPDKLFTVVWFGDEAGLLKSTSGMVKATKGNIKKAIAELDGIKPMSPVPFRPDGRLRGKTNLHGGVMCAFRAQKRGLIKGPEYVAAAGFTQGCDTIFILSDGDPTWDNWPKDDKNHHEDQVGDPESRQSMPDMPIMHYCGPYRNWSRLTDDVRRMNLFRKVEIHCIAIGEAQVGYLAGLARLGMGKAHNMGR